MQHLFAPYVDLYGRTPTTRAQRQPAPHVGQVHTWLVSADPDALLMHFDMARAKQHLHGGIVLNVGGYMGKALAYMTGAKAVIDIDLNALQAVHHRHFERHALLGSQDMDGFWNGVEQAEAATNAFWHNELDSCWLTGFAARELTRRESFRRLKAPLRQVLQGLGYAHSELCGLSPEAVAHNRAIAQAGNMYTAVIDLGCPQQMRQLTQFVDAISCKLAGPPGPDGARRLPLVAYDCNAIDFMIDYMNGTMDFCGMPSSRKRYDVARQSIQDLVFGERGQHTGTLISVKSDHEGKILTQDRHYSPHVPVPPPRPAKQPEPHQYELNFGVDAPA